MGYTKGKWEAKHIGGAGWGVFADLRESLGEKFSKDFPLVGNEALAAPKVQIAYETWVQFPSEEFAEMQEANMKLMAAAPDLLESLQEINKCIEWWSNNQDSPKSALKHFMDRADIVKSAIEKALGE